MHGEIEIDHDAHFTVKIKGQHFARSISSFDDPKLGLNDRILQNIKKIGYEEPTPIQCHGMPQMIDQFDMMCCSCTGSGKTATYLLPIINLIVSTSVDKSKTEMAACPKAVILTPTRELAEQIGSDAQRYSEGLPVKTVVVFGGDSIGRELKELRKKNMDILVATPGRLNHLLSEFGQYLTLEDTKFLVIDEADEMCNRSFFPQINDIVKGNMKPKEERVTAMFSATFPQQIQFYAKKHLRTDFVFVVVGIIGGAAPDIIQNFVPVSEVEKQMKLFEILEREAGDKKILIFSNMIEKVDILVGFLRRKDFKPAYIQSEICQKERDQAVEDFKEGKSRILVATSVASRGLNFGHAGLVINYDLPDNEAEYVQRIGRARKNENGDLGEAISFYDESNDAKLLPALKLVAKSANQSLPGFMSDGNLRDDGPEQFDEFVDDDMAERMRKFNIRPVYQAYETKDFF